MEWIVFGLAALVIVLYNLESVTLRFRKRPKPPKLPKIIIESLKKQLKD